MPEGQQVPKLLCCFNDWTIKEQLLPMSCHMTVISVLLVTFAEVMPEGQQVPKLLHGFSDWAIKEQPLPMSRHMTVIFVLLCFYFCRGDARGPAGAQAAARLRTTGHQ
jgi:hypothetical protein